MASLRRILACLLMAVLAIAAGSRSARAQAGSSGAEVNATADTTSADTTAADTTSATGDGDGADWLILPYASYSPETKIAGGMVFGFYPVPPPGQRPSSVQVVLTYTQRNQAIFELKPELYLRGEQWRIEGDVVVSEYPDSFYGIGGNTPEAFEETYTSRFAVADVSLQRTVRGDLFVGPRLHVRYETDPEVDAICMPSTDPRPSLACGTVAGVDGGLTTGLGVRTTWDRRDDLNYPTDGTFVDAAATWYSSALGGDFTYGQWKADLRGYRPAGPGAVAANVYVEGVAGTAPYQLLPLLGGSSRMRGYREGRFRDDVYWTTQLAYRVPLFWRFGAVAFASAGEVGPSVGSGLVRNVELAAGIGGRLRLTDGGVNGRLDLAYSASGLQLYVSLGEAF